MRLLLPRIFRAKEGKDGVLQVEARDEVTNPAGKPKRKAWTLRVLKRYGFRKVATHPEGKIATGVIKGPSARRGRKPNMASTQRKLAASHKRLRQLQRIADAKERPPERESPQRMTLPSYGSHTGTSSDEERRCRDVAVGVRRTNTGSAFLMNKTQGCPCIEVEFTDEGEDLSTGCRKGTRFPMTTLLGMQSDDSADIKVAWRESATGHLKLNTAPCDYTGSETPAGDSSQPAESSGRTSATSSGEEGSSSVCQREVMIAKLAGLRVQEAPVSQEYTAKKALRVKPSSEHRIGIPRSRAASSLPPRPASAHYTPACR